MFIPDSGSHFFHPESRAIKIPDPGSGSASKNLRIFNPENVSKLSEKLYGMFIPDPDPDFFPRIRMTFFSVSHLVKILAEAGAVEGHVCDAG